MADPHLPLDPWIAASIGVDLREGHGRRLAALRNELLSRLQTGLHLWPGAEVAWSHQWRPTCHVMKASKIIYIYNIYIYISYHINLLLMKIYYKMIANLNNVRKGFMWCHYRSSTSMITYIPYLSFLIISELFHRSRSSCKSWQKWGKTGVSVLHSGDHDSLQAYIPVWNTGWCPPSRP